MVTFWKRPAIDSGDSTNSSFSYLSNDFASDYAVSDIIGQQHFPTIDVDFEFGWNDITYAKGGSGGGGKPGGGGGGSGGGGSETLLTSYTSGSADPNDDEQEFNIKINFEGDWTAAQQAIVTWAADFYSQIITGDIENAAGIDDIEITVSSGYIDGRGSPLFGNILAGAEVTSSRESGLQSGLPLTGTILLDSTDLNNSRRAADWDDIILHEMGHVLGFNAETFAATGVVDPNGIYLGANAIAAYGGMPPIETEYGSGTAGSHWDEATFAPKGVLMPNELMTGIMVSGQQTYLSDTTIAAFRDIGYKTILDISPPYIPIDSGLLA